MIHILGVKEQNSMRCHHAKQNSMQLKTDELSMSRFFRLIFDQRWPRVTMDGKTSEKEEI
jgi:hypothetical protein